MALGIKRATRYLKRHRKDDNRVYFAGLSTTLLLILILGTFGVSVASYLSIRSGALASVIASVLVDLTNSDRQKLALNGLTVNPLLVEAARLKAEDMVAGGYFAHVSPDGKDSWHWFQKAGYVFSDAGENLAVDFSDSWDVETAWMNSPTHRANITNGRYTEIGIAVANGTYNGRQTTFVVQMFGTPAKQKEIQKPVQTEVIPEEPTTPAAASVEVRSSAVLGESTNVTSESVTPQKELVAEEVVHDESPIEQMRAIAQESSGSVVNQTAWYEKLLVAPKTVLSYAYLLFALSIIGSLLLTLRYELAQHHTRHAFAAVVLIVVMGGIFYVAHTMLFVPPTLALLSVDPLL